MSGDLVWKGATPIDIVMVNSCLRAGAGGSPTAVVPYHAGLGDTQLMQVPSLAGTSHVAALGPPVGRGDSRVIRFFTAEGELPGCGHGTVAVVAVLSSPPESTGFEGRLRVGGRDFDASGVRHPSVAVVGEPGGEVGDLVGDAGDEAGGKVGELVGEAGGKVGELVGEAGDEAGVVGGEAGGEVGELVGEAGDEAGGDLVGEAGDEAGGDLVAEVVEAWFDQGLVEQRPADPQLTRPLMAALGLGAEDLHPEDEPSMASPGKPRILLPVVDRDALMAIEPDQERLAFESRRHGLVGCFVYTPPSPSQRAAARMFAPAIGVPEDFANANSTGCLAAHLLAMGRGSAVTVDQGDALGRPCSVYATAARTSKGIATRVGGTARIVATSVMVPGGQFE